jgi:hypothetical protein
VSNPEKNKKINDEKHPFDLMRVLKNTMVNQNIGFDKSNRNIKNQKQP